VFEEQLFKKKKCLKKKIILSSVILDKYFEFLKIPI